MIHSTMILEDVVFITTLRYMEGSDYVFDVQACDSLTGESGKATWTKEQYRAVMFILIDAEDNHLGSSMIKDLYAIAEPAVAMLPTSCRPIP